MKKLKLAFFTILTLGLVSFAFIPKANYSPVFAEGEETTSSQPVEESSNTDEEVAKWKDMYNKAVDKYNQISNYQILGMTIGGIVSVLVSLGLTYLMGKVNRDNIRKQGEQLKMSDEQIKNVGKAADDMASDATAYKMSVAAYKELADEQVKAAKYQTEVAIEECKAIKEQMITERQMFLSIISNDKDLVANGTAEKINKLFSENK